MVCGQWCISTYDRMRSMFLSLSEIDSECYVDSGAASGL
jgi:hypothetical protein